MNISGDLSVSEFKTERYVEAVPIKKGRRVCREEFLFGSDKKFTRFRAEGIG